MRPGDTEREYCASYGYVDHFLGAADAHSLGEGLFCPHCYPTHPNNPDPPEPAIDMRALRVLRAGRHSGRSFPSDSTIFVPLPEALWRPVSGGCLCDFCKEHPQRRPYWDTLAIAIKPTAREADTTWLVHMPEAHQ